MSKRRSDRVSQLMRQIISESIALKWKNKNAHTITVHKVNVADNIRSIKVFVSIMGDEEQKELTMQALQESIGFFKREIGSQVKLRFMPELKFVYDDTLDYADKISKLLSSISNEK